MTALPAPLPPPEPGTRQLDADHDFFWRMEEEPYKVATAPPDEQPSLNVRALFVLLIFGFWCWVGVVVGVIMGLFLAHPPSPTVHPTPYVGSDNLGRGLVAFLLLAGVCVVAIAVGYSAHHEDHGTANDDY